jgi:PRTRC genetic system protein E
MKTNFFELMAGLQINGNLHLNINAGANGNLTVSLLMSPNDPKITGANNLPPLLFKGTAEELNEKFFAGITQPVKQTTAFIANLESYQAALEKAKKAAKPEKEKAAAKGAAEDADNEEAPDEGTNLFSAPEVDKEAKAERKKRYDDALLQIKELNGQMKYKEAISLLPDVAEYPEMATELEAKGAELRKRQQVLESLQQED